MVSALVLTATLWPGAATAREVTDYPSWDEVRAAQAAEASTKALIASIQAQLDGLREEATRTRLLAEEKGAVWSSAQEAADEQAVVTAALRLQADEAAAEMDSARTQVARLVAGLQRSGGLDFTATLLFSSAAPDSLLAALGTATKLAEVNAQLYERAAQLTNTARALEDQAAAAQAELDRRQEEALTAFEDAQAAAVAAEAILVEQQENEARLSAQLAVLTENRRATEADYARGIQEQWGAGAAGISVAPAPPWPKGKSSAWRFGKTIPRTVLAPSTCSTSMVLSRGMSVRANFPLIRSSPAHLATKSSTTAVIAAPPPRRSNSEC